LPIFKLTGYCQEPSIVFQTTSLYYEELQALLKIPMTKVVIPSYTSVFHIRSFEDLCKYVIFPFMQLYIPKAAKTTEDEDSFNE
jgi:hypothetical protein